MSNIIAAIDFSEGSLNALAHAVTVAQKGKLDLHMVWVNNPSVTRTTIYSDSAARLVDEIKSKFNALIDQYQPVLTDSKIDYVIREGKVYREISDEAGEMDSICIFMGTHGASGFEQFWIGSNANKLISVAKCPVITLRFGVKAEEQLRVIIMPLDSTLDTRQKVPFTAYIAGLFDAEIHVLALYASRFKAIRKQVDEYADQVCTFLADEGVRYVRASVQADNLTTATLEYAQKVHANLISIMTEQETSPYNLLIGPYAQQMVNQSSIPVLSINPFETMQIDSR